MSDRDAFIRAIAADLYDDTPRLAFADWLDDHGEHARAEFIRVQVELEPMRDRYELPRAAELHAREDELRKEAEWLGDMPAGWDKWDVGASVEFRRGFPDLFRCSAKVFLELGSTVRERHPTIRRAVIHCLNGWGERLAVCAALDGLAELELACWYADADMAALAASPHLSRLQVLELWMGRREGGPDANLVRAAARGKAWPNLRELVLLDPAGDSEKDVTKLAASANRAAKRKVARYARGYPELFPLNGAFYYDFPVAGHLADGRAAVIDIDEPPNALLVRTFTAAGAAHKKVIRLSLPPELAAEPRHDNDDGRYTQVARDGLGFEPGFIRVRENALGDFGPWRGHDYRWARCGDTDDPDGPTDFNGDPDPNGCGGEISWAVRGGEFRVGPSGWADKRGEVHST